MQRLIAIVLPEPVAILIASRWRLGSPGSIVIPCSANSSRSFEPAHRLDLGQVDEGLDRLALAEVEAERRPVSARCSSANQKPSSRREVADAPG